ncbi:hypothetical protein D3C87_782550 [compost metagenome]
MARIRTVKPEYWSSEQVMSLSLHARLAFIGLWNFCDDGGNHPASAKTFKAEVFPSDDLSAVDVQHLVDELLAQGLIAPYEAGSKAYWHVTGWKRHQRIDKPTIKHPPPPEDSAAALQGDAEPAGKNPRTLYEPSTSDQREIEEDSTNTRRTCVEPSTPEGKGEEGKGKEDKEGNNSAGAEPSAALDTCPHEKIIALYHEVLPLARRIREWTPARKQALRARWREKAERQNLDWWRKFFDYVATSDFLCGRTKSAPGRKPFDLSLDWLCKSENFVKVVEGAYDR